MEPYAFFQTLSERSGGHWTFCFLVGWPAITVSSLIRMQARSAAPIPMERLWSRGLTAAVIAPIVLVGVALSLTLLHHLLLVLLQASGVGPNGTLRVVVYALAGHSLLFWIPVIGVFLGIWLYARVLFAGLCAMHRAGRLRAAIAVVAPFLFCFGAGFFLH